MSNLSAEALRNRRAGQVRIKRYCSCGRRVVGNPGWASHLRANPDHAPISYARWCDMTERARRRAQEAPTV